MFRTVPLHEFDVPDARVTEWLKANDVNPEDVLASSLALIVGEEFIGFVGFHRDSAGKKVLEGSDESVMVTIKVPIVVSMKSAPENHGL
ncbi:hypothetical protein PV761_03230 [Arthrobacter sp. CC3]|uniref:hypothetical protein n=1 Tax=Arthrobacter sp. CC3 TaxID=3029185 RepID=UPI003267FAE1